LQRPIKPSLIYSEFRTDSVVPPPPNSRKMASSPSEIPRTVIGAALERACQQVKLSPIDRKKANDINTQYFNKMLGAWPYNVANATNVLRKIWRFSQKPARKIATAFMELVLQHLYNNHSSYETSVTSCDSDSQMTPGSPDSWCDTWTTDDCSTLSDCDLGLCSRCGREETCPGKSRDEEGRILGCLPSQGFEDFHIGYARDQYGQIIRDKYKVTRMPSWRSWYPWDGFVYKCDICETCTTDIETPCECWDEVDLRTIRIVGWRREPFTLARSCPPEIAELRRSIGLWTKTPTWQDIPIVANIDDCDTDCDTDSIGDVEPPMLRMSRLSTRTGKRGGGRRSDKKRPPKPPRKDVDTVSRKHASTRSGRKAHPGGKACYVLPGMEPRRMEKTHVAETVPGIDLAGICNLCEHPECPGRSYDAKDRMLGCIGPGGLPNHHLRLDHHTGMITPVHCKEWQLWTYWKPIGVLRYKCYLCEGQTGDDTVPCDCWYAVNPLDFYIVGWTTPSDPCGEKCVTPVLCKHNIKFRPKMEELSKTSPCADAWDRYFSCY
jgi:hypothetical protein